MKKVILRTHKQMKSNSFSDALFWTPRVVSSNDVFFALYFVQSPKKFNVHLCQKVPLSSAAPRPENPDSDEKDALFGLDRQITITKLLI
jgi:hypothetical protein